jgi:hypothetical protein
MEIICFLVVVMYLMLFSNLIPFFFNLRFILYRLWFILFVKWNLFEASIYPCLHCLVLMLVSHTVTYKYYADWQFKFFFSYLFNCRDHLHIWNPLWSTAIGLIPMDNSVILVYEIFG